jgi:hypothetical protein
MDNILKEIGTLNGTLKLSEFDRSIIHLIIVSDTMFQNKTPLFY